MAVVTTKAIVLSALKYGDTSLIVKCYTQEEGIKTYMVRGILKPKKKGITAAYFQPLTQLKIVANHNTKNTLNSLKEVQVYQPYKTIYNNIVKQSVVLFLSEVLSNAIQEEEQNTTLYEYIETALQWLDLHDNVANFHLLFLLNLTGFLGFYPDLSDTKKNGFDLLEGVYSDNYANKNVIYKNDFYQFKKLLGINFDAIQEVSFSKEERQVVLQIIIQYFKLHLGNFRNPKSLQVLETVFSG
ncbi:DNA repair protein RecO [Polaribacter dokdonensis]|uniref:DNA repair protein RecO n=1 Tax=Polaribacter dokdonensis DSW-5 TaxID=1300348 RepID=A0A0M9CF76_9FLAO|nr:DNA repair protein RecO [Polaribacter dokdonensis]KOY51302.1 DNA repair protein RecO [Polaribacter dokdonensis DSW-5]SEE14350.1 DNA replication and repair protein RecO [Polaribacter dokdonensis DSW-5]